MISLLIFYSCMSLKIPPSSVIIVQLPAQHSLNIVEIVYYYLLHLFLSWFLKSLSAIKNKSCHWSCVTSLAPLVWTGTGALLTWCGQELGLF